MHVGLKSDRLADVLGIAPVAQKLLQEALAPGRMCNRNAGHIARLAQDIVALTDIVGACEVEKVGVIDKARDLEPRKALHLFLELNYLLRAFGHRAEHVYDIINLKLPLLERGKIGVISAERHCAGRISADVEHAQIQSPAKADATAADILLGVTP